MALNAPADLRPKRRHPARLSPHYRYSRFVSTMKLVLPALAVVLLGLVIAWPRLNFEDERFQLGFAKLSTDSVRNLAMVNARYYGLDSHNRPFTVTADAATEENAETGIIVLDQPKADFTTGEGSGVYAEARRGFYHQKQQVLELEGEVSLFKDDGTELHTEKARLDLARNIAEGDSPVIGRGPQGRIDGQGFRILDKGRQIMVTGKSHLNLTGAGKK